MTETAKVTKPKATKTKTVDSLVSKLFAIQEELGPVVKGKKNPHFKSSYADINAMLEVVLPLFAKHRVLLLQPPVTSKLAPAETARTNYLHTILINADDPTDKFEFPIELPTESNPQKFGSALTYLRRYAIQSILALQAEDDDGNVAAGNRTGLPKATIKSNAGVPTPQW
jgi:hypothetical protein